MALLSEYSQGGAAVVLTVPLAPVSDIAIERRFGSFAVDMSVFGYRNRRKRLK